MATAAIKMHFLFDESWTTILQAVIVTEIDGGVQLTVDGGTILIVDNAE